jgi:hypothetical protein
MLILFYYIILATTVFIFFYFLMNFTMRWKILEHMFLPNFCLGSAFNSPSSFYKLKSSLDLFSGFLLSRSMGREDATWSSSNCGLSMFFCSIGE